MDCIMCSRGLVQPDLVVNGIHVCGECEGRIVDSDVNNPDYDALVERVKAFWLAMLEGREQPR